MNQQAESKSILQDLKEARAQIHGVVAGKKDEELPQGAAPVEAKAEVDETPVEVAEVAETPAKVDEPEELIRIGDQTFKTQSEAIKYAEKLENEKLLAESYNQGVREALQSTQKPEVVAPVEDNFDERFYSNPKETLKEVKEQAKNEIRAEFAAAQAEEKAWGKFTSLNPDLADSRVEVMRILQENWDVLGKMKDEDRAMGLLATKTRTYFQAIADKLKPRTELPNKQAQVVSPGGGSRPSVTPTKKEAAPLTMAEQLKNLRRRT